MTFLAPWALVVGALAAAGLVALHLVARQRPAAYPLPTARFVPDRRTLVSRISRRPRDLLLLALRVLLVASAAAAFARPVLTPQRSARTRVVLLDRSAAVANHADATARVREITRDGVPGRLLLFDTGVVAVELSGSALDSLDRAPIAGSGAIGSVSAALAAARRVGADVGAGADSVELVLVSPLTARELDPATDSIRALWPGGVRVVRLAAVPDSAELPPLERAIDDADVLGPALGARAVRRARGAVRLLSHAPLAADSAFAHAGGILVRWDSIGGQRAAPSAVAMGDDVVVASLGRGSLSTDGVVLARWADGAPAAVERSVGSGCLREVAIGVPTAGDLPLSPAFQRIVDGLTDACAGAHSAAGVPIDSARLAVLAGPAHAASGAALANPTDQGSTIVPWLLGLALACAVGELLVRRKSDRVATTDPAFVAEAA
jgi:hypothetical protein